MSNLPHEPEFEQAYKGMIPPAPPAPPYLSALPDKADKAHDRAGLHP